MGEQWYCMVIGQEVGPITPDDLKIMLEQGQIDADDVVRAGAEGDWQPVRDVFDVLNISGLDANSTASATAAVAEASASDERPDAANPTGTWYTRMLGSEFGPYTLEEICEQAARQQLAPDDEIRDGATGRWVAASTVPGLFTAAAIRQRSIEIEQARKEREQRKRKRRAQRRQPAGSPARPDDLLAGLDDLEDAEVPTADAAVSGAALPATGESLASTSTAPPPPTRTSAGASPADRPAPASLPTPSPSPPASSLGDSNAGFSSPRESPAPSTAPSEPERSPAANMMRDLAAAQLRAAQPPPRPTPRSPSKSSSGGGGGLNFDFSSLNLSGGAIGIVVAVVGVLVLGYFGYGMLDFASGAVYDQLVTLHSEFQQVAGADPQSPEFAAFYDKFKTQQRQMLSDIGTPSRGSTSDEVRRAVLALGTAIEAYRRPEMSPEDREPFVQAVERQIATLKQTFGR